jgi:hypothetical protein
MPSKKYTTIHVTDEDITRAVKAQSARCVIATAIARSIPGATKVAVDLQALRFTVDGERHVYFTPPGAVGYVVAFDAGDTIHPFSFRLSEAHRLPIAPTRPKSPAGIERTSASNRVRAAQRAVDKAEQVLSEATTDAEREVATTRLVERATKLDAARSAQEEVLAETAGQRTETSPQTGTRRVPTTFKRGSRHYGHRALRINQPDVDPDGRANVLSEYDRYAADG